MQSNYYVSDNDRFARVESQHISESVVQLTRKCISTIKSMKFAWLAKRERERNALCCAPCERARFKNVAEGHCGREIMSIVLFCKSSIIYR